MIYFQHVGERLSRRDLPKTVGTRERGLVRLRWRDVAPHLDNLTPTERDALEGTLTKAAPLGFQVWGSAVSAQRVLRDVAAGDYLLLLDSSLGRGSFRYAGRVVAAPERECPALSDDLWGEPDWPIITFMIGGLADLSFAQFCEDFGFSTHWHPGGQTFGLDQRRFQSSPYETEEAFIRKITGGVSFSNGRDVGFSDPAEVDLSSDEERELLRLHLEVERSGRLLHEFKDTLDKPVCCVCKFDFERVYGPIGREFIEAHFIKQPNEVEQSASADELVPVCSNCHRMLHRYSPMLEWTELKQVVASQYAAWLESD